MNRSIIAALLLAICSAAVLTAQPLRGLGQMPTPTRLTVAQLASERPSRIEMSMPRLDGSRVPMILERVAWTTEWAKCVVETEQGSVTTPLANDVVMYRAKQTWPGGDWTILALDRDGSIMGLTQQAGRRATIVRDAANTLQIRQQTSAKPRECMTSPDEISSAALSALRQAGTKTIEAPNANDTLTLELAVEVDNDAVYYAGSVADARLLVSLNMAAVSAVFEAELRTRVVVSYIRLWDKSNDPYPAQLSVFELLDVFRDEYMKNMTSISRDIAVFMTCQDQAGGIASAIGGLCDGDGAYCAVDFEPTSIAFPKWSWNVSLIAHELGHVCGGIHTHSCFWPNGALDSCTTAESGRCFSDDDVRPSRGTIMSYCSANGDPAFEDVLEFHPMHRLVLREYLQSSTCVGNQPRSRGCALQGTIRDVETGKPLPGVSLKIRPVIDDVYRGTPRPTGDTVVSSKADGTWMFTGLSRGLYAIDVDGPYAIYPEQVGENAFSFGVAVADSIERKDILVTKGQAVDIEIDNGGDESQTALNVFNTRIPGVLTIVPVPYPETPQTSVHVKRVLPEGATMIVPSAFGRRFSPPYIRVDASLDGSLQQVRFVSTSKGTDTSASGATAIIERSRLPNPQIRLMSDAPCSIKPYGPFGRIGGSTNSDGIFIFDGLNDGVVYQVIAEIDTTTHAPASNPGVLYPGYDVTGCVVSVQPRRFPLLARPYQYRTESGTFKPLESPEILREPKALGSLITTVPLPFPVRVLDRTLDTMYVHTNGFVTFGAGPFPAWAQTPVSMWNDADLVIAALGHEMTLDTNAPTGARISWAVEGVAPNRAVVVEWRSMTLLDFDKDKLTIVNLGRVSFQVRIHEGGNVDMVYDTEIPIPQPVDVQVGIRGNDVLDNQVVRTEGTSDILQSQATFDPNGTIRLRLTPSRQFVKGTTLHWELGPTSVYEEALDVTLAPNPVSEALTVRAIKDGTRISLVTLQGRVLMSQVSNGSSANIDVSALQQGAYLALIGFGSEVVVRPFTVVR